MESDGATFFFWAIPSSSQEGSFASITCSGGDTLSGGCISHDFFLVGPRNEILPY